MGIWKRHCPPIRPDHVKGAHISDPNHPPPAPDLDLHYYKALGERSRMSRLAQTVNHRYSLLRGEGAVTKAEWFFEGKWIKTRKDALDVQKITGGARDRTSRSPSRSSNRRA